jgi:predicted enzyme related to lactoylglutathione lyase
MTSRLSTVALVVPDYDAAIAFFVAGLGWQLLQDEPQGAKRWVRVAPAGGGAALLLARAEGGRQAAAVGNQCGGRVFLFLETQDFAADAARITAAGGRFEERPRHEPYGTVAVWQDPWGNRWDLIQPAST